MLVKKLLSFVTALSIVLSLVAVSQNAYAYNGSFPVIYDFENGTSGWAMGTTSKNAELVRENEDDNYFLRLTAKSGDKYNLSDDIDAVPNGYVDLDTPYMMEPDSEIIISADVRTSDTKLTRNLMFNRDKLNSEVSKEVQYNFATLWNWNKNNTVSTFEQVQTSTAGGYYKAKSNTAFTTLENNKWYTFCTVLYTDSEGLPKEIELKVYDGAAVDMTTGKRSIVNETLRLSNKITRLDFDLANASVTALAEDATFDIDNIRIYQNADGRFCKIKSNNDGNVFDNGKKISLSFNSPMDASTVNSDNIELYDSNDSKVDYSGSYNDNLWEYTITPAETLANGKYTIKISKDKINGIRQDNSVIYGMSAESASELQFVVFSGKLPEVKNLSISGKNLEGQTIVASGAFYQENGIAGHLTYQWWSSTSENEDYTKIDGATNSTFTVPSGFMNKYICVSAVPITDDNIISGDETFSNVISPPSKPTVKNITVDGELLEGETLTAAGEFYQEDGLSGYLNYQWWYSTTKSGTYEKIDGATGSSLKITSVLSDKYIKVSLTPVVDGDLLVGIEFYSDVKAPLSDPYAQDVKISGIAVSGLTLTLEYTFSDENNDNEAKSVYEWFISSDGSSGWTRIEGENSKWYVVSEEDIGKYIKAQVTPIADKEPRVGVPVQSSPIGPIKSIDSINLIKNSGFEGGVTTGWAVRNIGGDTATVTATKETAYSGEWSGRFEGQTQNSTYMVYGAGVKGNTRYIETCMMKVSEDSAKDNVEIVFYGEGNPERTYKYLEQNIIRKSGWSRVSQIFSVKTDGTFSEMPQYWANGSPGYIAYIDDFYVAPLLVYDIKANVPQSINIPASGEISSNVSVISIQNQIGTNLGMENETAFWEIDNDVEGVYIENDKIHVTNNAKSGIIKLKAVCIPKYNDAAQTIFVKEFPIELITNSNKTPRITNANLYGNTSSLSTLRLEYSFYQVDNSDDASTVKWYASDTIDGTYADTGKTGMSFDVTAEFLGKYIKAEITPTDINDRIGERAFSNIAGPKTAPEAKNVKIKGNGGYVGDVVESEYTYYDLNGDEEGSTKFQWWRSSSEAGIYEKISGAVNSTYTVTESDANCYIKLSVKPLSKKEPYEGEETFSNTVIGPRAPYAKSVTISRTGNVLIGKYTYVNDNGTEEGNTICQWLINGSVVGTGTRFERSFRTTTAVEFRVTPVAVKEPATGESVSAFQTVTGSGTGSGGGGGGGGGGAATSWVLNTVVPANTVVPENTVQNGIEDIQKHWSRQYAQFAVENGIMKTNANGMFEPDRSVTRAEIIEYIFKTMHYTETEYRGEFSDVSSNMSYANILQTLVDKGIISKDEKFRPDDNVSRQEVCRIISLALGLGSIGDELDAYSDKDEVGDWAAQHVKNMIFAGIMVGISQNEFSPKTNITNGQMARIVSAICAGNYKKSGESIPNDSTDQTLSNKIDLSSNDLKVVFIGGSLTQQGKVWEDMTVEALKAKLPGKNITYENMGLGGTGSGYGAFRYQHDVLSKNPDIVFIEFAINDKSAVGINNSRYMEEMVRQSLRSEKVPAIIFLYAPDPKAVATGEFEPWITGVGYKEKLAGYYGIKSVNISDYMLWDIENQGVDRVNYINEYYKSTGAGSWDVHGGYPKYGEAIVKAIEEDHESFLTVPRNKAVYHEENATDINYTVIPAESDKITYKGDWTKCVKGKFSPFDDNCTISDQHFEYFDGAIMQNLKKGAEFELASDAEAVKLQFISSKAGSSAKVYVDGAEKGTASTYSLNGNMNFDTEWVELPDDGKEHIVKYVIDAPASDRYVFTFGSVIERRK